MANVTIETREGRVRWAAKLERFEAPIIDAAHAAGRVPVIDYTECPVPPAIVRALALFNDADAKERAFRDSAGQRRSARNMRSLAVLMDKDDKPKKAAELREKADGLEAEAAALEALYLPL
jgi:hypothetical protein